MADMKYSSSTDAPTGNRLGSFGKAWFQLTEMEQTAVVAVLVLALLGVAVKYWHSGRAAPSPASVQARSSSEHSRQR
jgi:hypothetical protein